MDEVKDMTPEQLNEAVAVEVMGIDLRAVTDQDVAEAVWSGFWANSPLDDVRQEQCFRWNDTEYRLIVHGSKWGYGDIDGNEGYGFFQWQDRHGKPWQADIEAHVAKWRRRVNGYSTDISSAMKVVEKVRETHTFIIELPRRSERCSVRLFARGTKPAEAWHGSLSRALCVASLTAVRGTKEVKPT